MDLQRALFESFSLERNKGILSAKGIEMATGVSSTLWNTDTVGMLTWGGMVMLATLESLGRYGGAFQGGLNFWCLASFGCFSLRLA